MKSRGWRRALAFAAAVAAVVAGVSYFDRGDEGAGADVDLAAVSSPAPTGSSAAQAAVADAGPVQQPLGTGGRASADADASAVPEVAGEFAQPEPVSPSVPASYVQQSDGTYFEDGGLRTLVHTTHDAGDAAPGLEVPGQAYADAVGPHVEVGDSPLAPASGASAAIQQVPTEGTAPAPERLRSGAGPEAPRELPETAR